MMAEGEFKACDALSKSPNLVNELFDESKTKTTPLRQVEAYALKYHFFHYEVAFPEAFAGTRRGFDIVLGNPPWDKTKFADTDFFPQYHSNYRSLKNTEKAAVQTRLLESDHIATAYKTAVASQEAANEYYKDKSVFPLNKGAGDGNLFRLFVERNLGLLGDGGNLSYVLPSALMFEEGSTNLRKFIFANCRLAFFHSFENNKGIFPDVHRSYKFALMQVTKIPPASTDAPIDTAFYVLDPADLKNAQTHVAYPLDTVKALSPDQWALMELRDGDDLPILRKCYSAFPPLAGSWLDFRRELHMTDDKDLFIEKYTSGLLPLYEGKMIWQYSQRFETPQYWLDQQAFDERLHSKELHRMAQDLNSTKAEVTKHADQIHYDRSFVRLAFRTIARDTDERTLIFSLLPKGVGLGHSLFANAPKSYTIDEAGHMSIRVVPNTRLLLALAWFNSLPVDWLARQMIQINVSLTYLYRLPVPQPTDEEILANQDFTLLARNALLLTLASNWDDFAELATQFNIDRADVPATAKARDHLRADIDKVVARLYGITDGEFTHLLRSFKGMATKRPEYIALLQ
jgi:hypothetical protein